MSDELTQIPDSEDGFYTLVPEQGMCLLGDEIINLRKVVLIRKVDGKTQLYYEGAADPIILPASAFDRVREAVFAVDDLDDEDFDDDDEE